MSGFESPARYSYIVVVRFRVARFAISAKVGGDRLGRVLADDPSLDLAELFRASCR